MNLISGHDFDFINVTVNVSQKLQCMKTSFKKYFLAEPSLPTCDVS